MKTKIFIHKLLTVGAIVALGLGVSISVQAVPGAYGIATLETRNFNVQFSASGTDNDNFGTLNNVNGSLTVDDSCSSQLAIPDDNDGGDNAAGFNFPGLLPPLILDTDDALGDPADCGIVSVDDNFNSEGRVGDYSRGDTLVSDTSFAGTGAGDVIGEAFTGGNDHLDQTFQGDGRFTLSVDFEVTEDTRIDVSYDTLYAIFAELTMAGPGSLANAEFKQILTVTNLATNMVELNLNLSGDAGVSDANVVGPTVFDSDGNEIPIAFPTAGSVELVSGAYKLEFTSSVSARVKLFEPDIVVRGDHFLCYKSFGSFLREEVNLFDQFDTDEGINFDVLKPKMFCNPAIKPELDPDAMLELGPHYLSYKINEAHREPRHERKMAEVQNQFGTMIVETFKPDRLMVPSGKSLDLAVPPAIPVPSANTNHYKCYTVRATGFQSPGEVAVMDQFTDEDGKKLGIVRPTRLCNPVEKTRSDGVITPIIEDPDNDLDHLMCYSVRAGAGERLHKKTKVLSNNQFREEELVLKRELEFCVPTMKTLLTPDQ